MVSEVYASYTIPNPTAYENVGQIVTTLIPNALFVAGILLFALLVMSGFSYMTSGGDDKALAKAKKTMTYALMGFLIVFGSGFIIRILETILGIPDMLFGP